MNWPPVTEAIRLIDVLAWALVLAVFITTLLALGVWVFLHTRAGRAPARRHTTALGALVAAVVLLGATWWGLDRVPTSTIPATTASVPARQRLTPAIVPDATAFQGRTDATSPAGLPLLDASRAVVTILSPALPWVSVSWLIGVALLAVRLVGGLLIGWRIRRRATPVTSGSVVEAVGRLAKLRRLEQPLAVALSDDVNAPSVAGWRRPLLLLPRDVEASLAQEQLESVVVHELEHVRRGDAWLGLVQAASNAVLFFCPGAHWLSKLALEAREQVCDDAAIHVCGNPKAYAGALGVLATRSSGAWLMAAMGQQAPSLAARIRRIVRGDIMPVITPVKFTVAVSGIVLAIAAGAIVLSASVEHVRLSLPQPGGPAATQPRQQTGSLRVPTGFAQTQPGAPVTLTRATGDEEHAFTRVGLRNTSGRKVVAVTFLAVVQRRSNNGPAILTASEPIPVALGPGETSEVLFKLLPLSDLLEWKQSKQAIPQAFLGVVKVSFADGDEWAIVPPAEALTEDEVLYLPRGVLSRASLSDSSQLGRPGSLCRDDKGLEYSEGAIVKLRGEEARARCTGGRWIEQKDPVVEASTWVKFFFDVESAAAVKVEPSEYTGAPWGSISAKSLIDGTYSTSTKFILRAWSDGANVVVQVRTRTGDGRELDFSTFRMAVGESREVVETERLGVAHLFVVSYRR